VIASNFEGVDLTAPIVVAALMAAMIVGATGRALRNAGLRHVGEVGMAAAVVVLIAGTWVGIQQKSIYQVKREEAVEACVEDYPRFLEWERSGNSLDNWWTGDPISHDVEVKRATKQGFIDRCVEMSVD
jgi:hypothetical protein